MLLLRAGELIAAASPLLLEEERREEEEAPLLEEERLEEAEEALLLEEERREEEEEAPLLEEERLEEAEERLEEAAAPMLEEERLEEEAAPSQVEERPAEETWLAATAARGRIEDRLRRRTALLQAAVPTRGLAGRAPLACLTCLGGCTSPPGPPRRLTRPWQPFAAPWPPTGSTTRSTSWPGLSRLSRRRSPHGYVATRRSSPSCPALSGRQRGSDESSLCWTPVPHTASSAHPSLAYSTFLHRPHQVPRRLAWHLQGPSSRYPRQ